MLYCPDIVLGKHLQTKCLQPTVKLNKIFYKEYKKSFYCRQLFEAEQSRLSRKYGRYCINNSRSSIIVDQNIKFFSSYQFSNHLELRIDAMLIKPIQRLTRYQLFLSSISKTCQDLGYKEAGAEFNLALESVLSAAGHTNTMMWIGKMVNCPIDLPSQGQLIKHGKVKLRGSNAMTGGFCSHVYCTTATSNMKSI